MHANFLVFQRWKKDRNCWRSPSRQNPQHHRTKYLEDFRLYCKKLSFRKTCKLRYTTRLCLMILAEIKYIDIQNSRLFTSIRVLRRIRGRNAFILHTNAWNYSLIGFLINQWSVWYFLWLKYIYSQLDAWKWVNW